MFSGLSDAGFVQFLQCYYQSGCLYRLRALGERHNMDLTVGEGRQRAMDTPSTGTSSVTRKQRNMFFFKPIISCVSQLLITTANNQHNFLFLEGFQSWMWKGLTFLLPFLFFGHVSKICDSLSRCCCLVGIKLSASSRFRPEDSVMPTTASPRSRPAAVVL